MHYFELVDQAETSTELMIHLLFKTQLGKALKKKSWVPFQENQISVLFIVFLLRPVVGIGKYNELVGIHLRPCLGFSKRTSRIHAFLALR